MHFKLQSNLFGGCLDDSGLYMNTETALQADMAKSSSPSTPSSRSAAAAVMKHDVGACLAAVGYGGSSAVYGTGSGGSDLVGGSSGSGCHRPAPFHCSPAGSFGESMLDQLQVVPGHSESQPQHQHQHSQHQIYGSSGQSPMYGGRNTSGTSSQQQQQQQQTAQHPHHQHQQHASLYGGYHSSSGAGGGVHLGGGATPSGGSLGGVTGGPATMVVGGLHHPVELHIGTPSECDTRELEAFAEHFKQRRIKIGVTQADVGAALGKLKLPGVGSLSQSTICRFESLTLSHNNMVALKPVLQAWLEEAERQARDSRLRNDVFGGTAGSGADRKRKRTSIATPEKRSLEAYFAIQPRPSGEKIAQIAEKLDLKKNVVRVWFCNQRQKQKRMKFAAGALQVPH